MRYLILFLLAGSVMAEDFKVEPIQYDIPESKWGKAEWYTTKGRCTNPMNLYAVCPSKGALLFQQKVSDFKKKVALAAAAKAKAIATKTDTIKIKSVKKEVNHV